jgi:hypothetical protein
MLAALLLAAAAPQASTPKAFVTQLYAHYRDARFSPFDHIDAIFAPRLAAAIRLDRKLAHGEIGALDSDPICLCQDSEGLRGEIRRIAMVAPDQAVVTLTLHYAATPPTAPARLTLHHVAAGWRVADIAMDDGHSLLNWLMLQNRQAARH